MQIAFAATQFILHVALVKGRSRSPKTWKAYAYTLCAYLNFLESRGTHWRLADEETVAHFRFYLESKSLVRATIARWTSIVCAFYDWAFDKGYIARSIISKEERAGTSGGMLKHVSSTRRYYKPTVVPNVPSRRRYPRYYNVEEQRQIYDNLDERNQLMVDWALYTGAREFEVCALTTDQIPAPSVFRARSVYPLALIVAKGNATKPLWVPTWLLRKTYKYIKLFGRTEIVRHAKRRGNRTTSHIFLSRWGAPLKPDSLYRAFRQALKAAGLKGTFHALRHTYAISMLHRLMQLPQYSGSDGVTAILELENLLRHSDIKNTMIYLEARRFYLTSTFSNLFELPESADY